MIRWPWQYLKAAREQYEKAHNDDERVEQVAREAERIREQNGFLAAIDQAFGGNHERH